MWQYWEWVMVIVEMYVHMMLFKDFLFSLLSPEFEFSDVTDETSQIDDWLISQSTQDTCNSLDNLLFAVFMFLNA